MSTYLTIQQIRYKKIKIIDYIWADKIRATITLSVSLRNCIFEKKTF